VLPAAVVVRAAKCASLSRTRPPRARSKRRLLGSGPRSWRTHGRRAARGGDAHEQDTFAGGSRPWNESEGHGLTPAVPCSQGCWRRRPATTPLRRTPEAALRPRRWGPPVLLDDLIGCSTQGCIVAESPFSDCRCRTVVECIDGQDTRTASFRASSWASVSSSPIDIVVRSASA